MGLWNPTLREVREGWATPVCGGVDRQQVPRLRKIIRLADDLSPLGMTRFYGDCATSEVVSFTGVALAKFSEGWGCGIPLFAKCAKDGPPRFVVVSTDSRFLDS